MSAHMRFSIIPGWCATDPRLTGRDLQVLCVLGRHIDKQGWCTRSQVKVALELGCARGTVQNSLKRLAEIGVVETRVNETPDGRDCAHDYRVIFDGPAPESPVFRAADTGENERQNSPEMAAAGHPPPANILAPPANPELAPPANPGLAPYKNVPLKTPPEERLRENAGAGAQAGEGGEAEAAAVTRGTGAQAFRSAHAGWPTFTSDSSPEAERAWFALTPEERLAAVANAARYVAASRADGRKLVCAFAVYLREKRWEKLPVEAVAVEAKRAPAAAPFGPVWAALRMLKLAAGPERKPDGFDDPRGHAEKIHAALKAYDPARAANWRDRHGATLAGDELVFPAGFDAAYRLARQASDGFPSVNRMQDAAGDGRPEPCAEGDLALAALCEPVPIGSALFAEWRGEHEARGWPWLSRFGGRPIVYFPKGGPDRLDDFFAAAKGQG